MARKRIKTEEAPKSYFVSDKEHLSFVSTGCTLLDCALGGGFVLGRIANLVGDKSTSKTGLSMECLINFVRKYPNGIAGYRDCEAAFDTQYAQAMGLPLDKIDFGPEERIVTVEGWYRDLNKFLDKCIKADAPGIYVLDSLDAISDEAEMERDIGDATYGGNKAKKLSEFFRKLTPKIESSKVLVLIVNQIRDNIGAMFGEKHKRSGGKALDFYATHIVWLAHIERLTKTVKGMKRAYGITVRAQVKKNKVAMPFRDCDFEYHFGFGIEDVISNAEWLKKAGRLKDVGIKDSSFKEYLNDVQRLPDEDYRKEQVDLAAAVRKVWSEIETDFLPKRTKYA